ncbi:MAG TPA: chloride channel protein, partial [Candidatus Methylomirabilis sp.]|nr:chloride channel protein [Candidatus Methylomirabilis sp.]
GYATIQDVLTGNLAGTWLLVLLFGLKLLATALTLGSGASGGVFSPALFMGATVGGAYGALLGSLFPELSASPTAFAVAGMAGVVGGSTGAALAAIVMIFEMTLDYNVVIPMTITVALSYGIRKVLSAESIYTLKLVRRGHHMPEALVSNFQQLRQVSQVMEAQFGSVPAETPLKVFARMALADSARTWYLVTKDSRVAGLATRDMAFPAFGDSGTSATIADVALRQYVMVSETATVADVAGRLRATGSVVALVTRNTGDTAVANVAGLVSRHQLGDAMSEAADQFGT